MYFRILNEELFGTPESSKSQASKKLPSTTGKVFFLTTFFYQPKPPGLSVKAAEIGGFFWIPRMTPFFGGRIPMRCYEMYINCLALGHGRGSFGC